jgi:hypothetical protein
MADLLSTLQSQYGTLDPSLSARYTMPTMNFYTLLQSAKDAGAQHALQDASAVEQQTASGPGTDKIQTSIDAINNALKLGQQGFKLYNWLNPSSLATSAPISNTGLSAIPGITEGLQAGGTGIGEEALGLTGGATTGLTTPLASTALSSIPGITSGLAAGGTGAGEEAMGLTGAAAGASPGLAALGPLGMAAALSYMSWKNKEANDKIARAMNDAKNALEVSAQNPQYHADLINRVENNPGIVAMANGTAKENLFPSWTDLVGTGAGMERPSMDFLMQLAMRDEPGMFPNFNKAYANYAQNFAPRINSENTGDSGR